MRLEKNYPIYKFVMDNGKHISIDLSKNGEPIVGVSGRALKKYPSQLEFPYARTLITYYFDRTETNKSNFELYDRFCSYWNANDNISDFGITFYDMDYLRSLIDEFGFKTVADHLKLNNFEEARCFSYYRVKRFLTVVTKCENLTEEQRNIILNVLNSISGDDIDVVMSSVKLRNLILKYYNSPLAYFTSPTTVVARIIDYGKKCKAAHLEIETGDLLQNYKKACETYKAKLEEIENETFAKSQTEKNLFYENDNFTIVIPLTRAECIDEGTKLNNCLGNYEWNNWLRNGYRKVVFIRRKNAPNTSYIACDMDNNFTIHQFLTHNNEYVRDDEAIRFKAEYQVYLSTLVNN